MRPRYDCGPASTAAMVLVTGDDVIGHVVNLAARVTGSAAGGELVVTDHVRTAVGDLRGVAFDGPYTRSFKGIEEKVQVYFASRHDHRIADPPTDPAAPRDLLVNDDEAHGR